MNLHEAFNKQLREAAIKWEESKKASEVLNPKQSTKYGSVYITKYANEFDYFA